MSTNSIQYRKFAKLRAYLIANGYTDAKSIAMGAADCGITVAQWEQWEYEIVIDEMEYESNMRSANKGW